MEKSGEYELFAVYSIIDRISIGLERRGRVAKKRPRVCIL